MVDPQFSLAQAARHTDKDNDSAAVFAVAMSPPGTTEDAEQDVFVTAGDTVATFWDSSTLKPIARYDTPTRKAAKLKKQSEAFACCDVTRIDGKTIIAACAGFFGDIRLFLPHQRLCYHKFKPSGATEITSLRFHPKDPTILALGTRNEYVLLYRITKPDENSKAISEEIRRLDAHETAVIDIAWHPQGDWFLTVGTDSKIFRWTYESNDVADEELLMPEYEHDFFSDEKEISSIDYFERDLAITRRPHDTVIPIWDEEAATVPLNEVKAKWGAKFKGKEFTKLLENRKLIARLKLTSCEGVPNRYMRGRLSYDSKYYACGTSQQKVALFDLSPVRENAKKARTEGMVKPIDIDPVCELECSKLNPASNYRCVALNHDASLVVGVTDKNAVLCWRAAAPQSS